MRNFHLPLPEETYDRLRRAAERSKEPATALAREAIECWLRQQLREEHWMIAGLLGKAGYVRTVPIPGWVKEAIDTWKEAAGITEGTLLRSINEAGRVSRNGMTPKVLREVLGGSVARGQRETRPT
jgi:predicted transcriptional regulator